MKYIFLFAALTLLLIKTEAQTYHSRIIPFNGNPTVAGIDAIEDQFIISAISFIEDTVGSTFIFLDSELGAVKEIELRGFAANDGGIIVREEDIFVFGNNNRQSEFVTFLKTDWQFNQYQKFDFQSNSEFNFASTSMILNENIFTLTVDDYFNPERRDNFLQKIDLEGNDIWNKTLGEDKNYTVGIDLQCTESGHLLVGSTIILQGKFYAELVKLDQQGMEVWNYQSSESPEFGNPLHYTTELSNNNLLNISTVDRSQNEDFIVNDWNENPPKLIWLDSAGKTLADTLLISSDDEPYTYSGVKKGRGNYFFIYGNKGNLDFLSGDVGWLCKVSNDGEFIWNKKYHHPELKNSGHFHNIKTILELDNGDLITLGTAVKPGESQKIWTMRLNSDGCFDNVICGDIPTSSNELLVPTEKIKIYPNPSNGLIKFSIDENSKIDIKSIAVLNAEGKMVHSEIYDRQNQFDLSNLSKGLYFVQFTFANGSSYLEKLILD